MSADLLTPTEVAAFLRLPVATVREGLRRGEIPGARVMYRWRTRRADLEALVAPAPVADPAPLTPPPGVVLGEIPPPGRPGRPRKRRRRTGP